MDFNKVITELLSQGAEPEELAKEFTEALNQISAANKSKKERDKYINDSRKSVLSDLNDWHETFSTAATVAAIAAARMYPKMSLKDLQDYEIATREAMKATASFHNDINGEGKGIFEALFDALPIEKEKEPVTDEEKIAQFLRKLG